MNIKSISEELENLKKRIQTTENNYNSALNSILFEKTTIPVSEYSNFVFKSEKNTSLSISFICTASAPTTAFIDIAMNNVVLKSYLFDMTINTPIKFVFSTSITDGGTLSIRPNNSTYLISDLSISIIGLNATKIGCVNYLDWAATTVGFRMLCVTEGKTIIYDSSLSQLYKQNNENLSHISSFASIDNSNVLSVFGHIENSTLKVLLPEPVVSASVDIDTGVSDFCFIPFIASKITFAMYIKNEKLYYKCLTLNYATKTITKGTEQSLTLPFGVYAKKLNALRLSDNECILFIEYRGGTYASIISTTNNNIVINKLNPLSLIDIISAYKNASNIYLYKKSIDNIITEYPLNQNGHNLDLGNFTKLRHADAYIRYGDKAAVCLDNGLIIPITL
ncbi:MAG: hypothetical protein RR054_06115 [Clostridia bacterium]